MMFSSLLVHHQSIARNSVLLMPTSCRAAFHGDHIPIHERGVCLLQSPTFALIIELVAQRLLNADVHDAFVPSGRCNGRLGHSNGTKQPLPVSAWQMCFNSIISFDTSNSTKASEA